MIKRPIKTLLEAWGEWERYQRDYLKPLGYRSAMLAIDGLAVKTGKAFLPALDDEEAAGVCEGMAAMLREHTEQYTLLKHHYYFGWTPDDMARKEKTTPYFMRLKIADAEGVARVYLKNFVLREESLQ